MKTKANNGQNSAATSAVKYVDNFSNDLVWVYNRDHRTRGGSFNWQIDAVKMIVDRFTFVDTDTDSLNVSVLVYENQITVKAEFNGKEYMCAKPITAETGKKEIKRILDDMGVVEDVIKRETERMMEQMMEQEDNTIVLTEEDVINEVVEVINANLIDDATEGQKLDWTLFSDNTMEYLFTNGGPELYEKIKNGVKSRRIAEVLAYDDCFYVWYDEEPAKNDAPILDEDETETNVCCICGKTYEGYGNNADPLAKGRCCDECNADVIKRRVEYQWASDILRPMVEKLGDNREQMFVSESEVDGVPVTLELLRPRDRYMVFVKTYHEKGYEWLRLFNDYLDYAYNN